MEPTLPDENPVRGQLVGLAATFAFVALWILAALCAGCASAPEDPATLLLDAAWAHWKKHHDTATAEAGAVTPAPAEDSAASVAGSPLVWRFGGFDGSKAVEDPRCRLSSPTIMADSIRYKWESGVPSDWARNKTESGSLVIAAAFFWDEDAKKWVGGKFEWTDESRSSRDCRNIYEGYGGWHAAAWEYAAKRAFCVVSVDGKYRSNLLED